MAIRFNTSDLSSSNNNIFKIEKFNGVDYTTTPTLVDNSRATDMSNYLPQGDSLVKRNGLKFLGRLLNRTKKNDKEIHIIDIWNFGVINNLKYYIVYGYRKDSGNYIPALYSIFVDVGEELKFEEATPDEIVTFSARTNLDELYSYGVKLDDRLFLLLENDYSMVFYDEEHSDFKYESVKDFAYIPTLVSSIGAMQWRRFGTSNDMPYYGEVFGTEVDSVMLEPINLLTNTIKLELLKPAYTQDGTQQLGGGIIAHYDIGTYLPENITITSLKINETQYPLILDVLQQDNLVINNEQYNLWNGPKKYLTSFEYHQGINSIGEKYMLGFKTTNKQSSNVDPLISLEITFVYNDETNPSDVVTKMRFGALYGSTGYGDRFFISGNPKYPNLDIRTRDAMFASERWKSYTYFGDDSYTTFGSSDSKIIGYGMMNNGYMVVLKENDGKNPNLFCRVHETSIADDNTVLENYSITNSGTVLNVNKDSNIISYGNDLLVSTPNGIYKVVVGESTATQTYYLNEMSYFIRENINDDLTNSKLFVYNNRLYWYKKDVEGRYRIYVADENKYSVVNGTQTYEWWVLDNINFTEIFIFENELYFIINDGLYLFGDNFIDEIEYLVEDIEVDTEEMSKSVFIDNVKDELIVTKTSDLIQEIINSNNVYDRYLNIVKNGYVSFNGDSRIIPSIDSFSFNIENKILTVNYTEEQKGTLLECFYNSFEDGELLFACNNEGCYVNEFFEESYDEETKLYTLKIGYKTKIGTGYPDGFYFLENKKTYYKINELYTRVGNYPFTECECIDNDFYYVGPKRDQYIYLGNVKDDNAIFNKFTIMYRNSKIDFHIASTISKVDFKLYAPIFSYWKGNYNSLSREDYLKTVDKLTFVADSRRGGITRVGYKTKRNNSMYESEEIKRKLDFNFVDFNDFSFGYDPFAITHTSKKKIKNFSFMQILFESDTNEDSTITSLTLRYKYTKNNKGVR